MITHVVAAFIAAFVITEITITVTSVYLHRCLSHRSLTIHPAVALPFRGFLWITTGMRPREWVAVHRKHHAATDTPEDPHSPAVVGFWRVQLGNVGLYKRAATDPVNIRKYARDIPSDTLDRYAFDHSLLGLGTGIAIIVTVMWALGFGLWAGFLAAGLHAVFYVMLSGSINAVTHTYGARPYKSSATNLQSLALITGGEGLHNNHHAAPTSARFSLSKGELDPGWWMVRALVAFRLAHVRHDEVHLKTRGMSCAVCGFNAVTERGDDDDAIVRLQTGYAKLQPNQYFRGSMFFSARTCASELHLLTPRERTLFLHEMSEVAHALWRVVTPRKLNYELLGNQEAHMHWHLYPRYETDAIPQWPVWSDPKLHEGITALPAAERDKLRGAVLAELRAADVEIEVAYL